MSYTLVPIMGREFFLEMREHKFLHLWASCLGSSAYSLRGTSEVTTEVKDRTSSCHSSTALRS
ncbi:hypothetical protein KS419_18390, partial [Bacillus tamaricis]